MKLKNIAALLGILSVFSTGTAYAQNDIGLWLTKLDRSALFAKQDNIEYAKESNTYPTILINEKESFQSIDGFGYSLTGGSAQHIIKMGAAARAKLLKELFATDGNNIGVSYIRLSIGASDLNEKVFSYNDLPEGQQDLEQAKFDLGPDRADVIPVMKEILAINPKIKILGSPWSPPLWMKTAYDARGGQLKPEYYESYAIYFVKYVQQMKKEGIRIDAITVQNEPLHPGNNPSLLMVAPDQATFIKKNLGPAFKKAGIDTKIILYDHNADRPDYPISILDDPEANKYIDGSGFHLYGGSIEALTDVHNAHPDKHIYFTEQMVVENPNNKEINIINPIRRLIIGATRNWSRNVLEWNLAADPENKPFTDRGGCPMCQGAVTISGDSYTRNLAYYSIAHASKFVRPGSVRIASNELKGLPNVAFKTPGGKKVLIVANTSKEKQTFNISLGGKTAVATLDKGSVATYIF
ncbi:MAG TPA: glycoside hydrolase family 30 beta sandwich domain-containing protein [Pedobacter sp.]|uniref:glycoside hydrolase family 30 protein n=1 Tax=Pedobacter sp. TaxID=1411316 RepID=UPI002BD68549|nr:glycoside hydrolase family 30 beta sandwich domain-containing protein [Pedobacter sp.]HMI02229.1 glycoside hydrolase family 30 beta sandwich domain-containing protein [Pedobacter sp.]